MAGTPQPKLISVAPFAPDPNAKSFAEIWNETMGNLGTSTDGFDNLFGQMVGMTNSIAPNADIDPSDLAALGGANAALDTMDAGALALSLQPARTATDRALGDYLGLTQPSATPTNPVTPPGATPPAPQPVACTQDPTNPPKVLPDMNAGDAPFVMYIDSEVYGGSEAPLDITGKVLCGDTDVFLSQRVKTLYSYGGGGAQYLMTLNFVIVPAKPGTFTGAYRETETSTGITTDTWVTVTINALNKGTGGQPLGHQP